MQMIGIGSARPRLLLVGSTLLLAGGRMRFKTADGLGPSTDNGLWSTDAASLAAGSALPTWQAYAISYWHNRLYDGSEGGPGHFSPGVNSTKVNGGETNSYNALVPSGSGGALLIYTVSGRDWRNDSVAVGGVPPSAAARKRATHPVTSARSSMRCPSRSPTRRVLMWLL